MGKYVKKILFTFSVLVFSILSVNLAYGAEAKITVGTASVVEGEEVAVKVQITSDVPMVAGDIWLTYDTSVITYKSGADTEGDGGLIRFIIDSDGTATSIEREIVFVGKKAGSCEITATANCEIVDFDTLELMKVSSVAGKVTVTTPTVASSDNTLKKLVVYGVDTGKQSHKLALTPSFGAEKTEYTLSVEANIAQLSVTATPNDSKATVKVSGLKLAEGDNVTTIKVTAENGDSKTYYIYTEKAEADEDETTKAPDTGNNDDVPPADEGEYIEVIIGEKTMFIPVAPKDIALPEGFEAVEYTYKEKAVQAAKGLSKNILIFYILDENKENGSFYIYDEASDKFYPMVNIQTGEKMYTIVSVPADFVVPEGFVDTTFKFGDKETAAWTYGEVSDFVYVYAMNWDGNCAVYCYDTVEKTMQRMSEYAGNSSLNTEFEALKAENSKNLSEIESLKNENDELKKFRKIIIIIIIVIIIILLGMIIWNIISMRSRKDKGPDDDGDGKKKKSEEAITTEDAINTLFADNTVEDESDADGADEEDVAETDEEAEKDETVEETAERAETVEESIEESAEQSVAEADVTDNSVEETVAEEIAEVPVQEALSVEESIKKENMVPDGGEAIVAGLFTAEETVDASKMIPDDSEYSEKVVKDTKTDAERAIEEEQAMISKMADDEIEKLTADLSMEVVTASEEELRKENAKQKLQATEELIDRLLDIDVD